MQSILEPLRKSWNVDTPEEQCGIACGRRWALTSATLDELHRLAVLSACPSYTSWVEELDRAAIITPERLVDIIGGASCSSFECVDFWNRIFGDSEQHAAIWRVPAFTRGFIAGTVEVWNRRYGIDANGARTFTGVPKN